MWKLKVCFSFHSCVSFFFLSHYFFSLFVYRKHWSHLVNIITQHDTWLVSCKERYLHHCRSADSSRTTCVCVLCLLPRCWTALIQHQRCHDRLSNVLLFCFWAFILRILSNHTKPHAMHTATGSSQCKGTTHLVLQLYHQHSQHWGMANWMVHESARPITASFYSRDLSRKSRRMVISQGRRGVMGWIYAT